MSQFNIEYKIQEQPNAVRIATVIAPDELRAEQKFLREFVPQTATLKDKHVRIVRTLRC